jgi:hypothetical protein
MIKDIIGYEGLYTISNEGVVVGLPRVVQRSGIGKGGHPCKQMTIKSKELKPYIAKNGYYVVNLNKNGVAKTRYIHDLIASHFIGERPSRYTINHKDGNKLNNSISNLEYCTYSENNEHARRIGLNKHRVSDYAKRVPVSVYKDGVHISDFNSCYEAEVALKCHHVSSIINGNRKTSKGYTFKIKAS